MFQRRTRNKRKGVAATEFAMVLPVMLILTFGTIEACQVIFLKEKAVLAAHEGARIAIRKMTTKAQATTIASNYLQARGVDTNTLGPSDIAIWPAPESVQALNPINVRVRIPVSGNTILPNMFYSWFSTGTVEGKVVMYKEFQHPSSAGS